MPTEKNMGMAAVLIATCPLDLEAAGAPRPIPEWAVTLVAHILDDADAQTKHLQEVIDRVHAALSLVQSRTPVVMPPAAVMDLQRLALDAVAEAVKNTRRPG